MPYTSPASVSAGTTITSAWGNSVKAGEDFLANPPACRVYNNALQSIPNSANTAITFNSERYDTDNMHSTSVNTSRITLTTAGLYTLTGHVEWASNATGGRSVFFILNGATLIGAHSTNSPGTGNFSMSVSTTYKFTAGQYVELWVAQFSGGALNINASGNYSPEATATWIGLG